jgi:hypothetical protein
MAFSRALTCLTVITDGYHAITDKSWTHTAAMRKVNSNKGISANSQEGPTP